MVFIFVTLLFHKNKQNPTNNNVFLLFFFFTDFRLRQQGVKMKKRNRIPIAGMRFLHYSLTCLSKHCFSL